MIEMDRSCTWLNLLEFPIDTLVLPLERAGRLQKREQNILHLRSTHFINPGKIEWAFTFLFFHVFRWVIILIICKSKQSTMETVLFKAAEKGYIEVVKELLPYSTKEGIRAKNKSGLDPLHVAANQGHHDIVRILLEHDPDLSKTVGQSNATPLISAATKGHLEVVQELLLKDSSLLEISRSNGKNALHFAARQGHLDIVQALLEKDPQLARRTDKKGQTALHMAVKGVNCAVVKLLLRADAAIVMLPDKFGNTELHIATRKKRAESEKRKRKAQLQEATKKKLMKRVERKMAAVARDRAWAERLIELVCC